VREESPSLGALPCHCRARRSAVPLPGSALCRATAGLVRRGTAGTPHRTVGTLHGVGETYAEIEELLSDGEMSQRVASLGARAMKSLAEASSSA
jgi:hypothetical protein